MKDVTKPINFPADLKSNLERVRIFHEAIKDMIGCDEAVTREFAKELFGIGGKVVRAIKRLEREGVSKVEVQ